MSTLDILLIAVAAVALINICSSPKARRYSTSHPTGTDKRSEKSPSWLDCLRLSGVYWGIRISTPNDLPCCKKARELANTTFPLDEAPRLPLEGCDYTQCRCCYSPLLDKRATSPRRMTADRRINFRYEPLRPSRRKLSDRRRLIQWQAAH